MKSIIKKAYQSLPFKRQIFSGIKSIGTPPERIYRHLHFDDKFKVEVEPGKNFDIYSDGAQIANEVFWEGLYKGWEGKSIEMWRDACRKSSVMFDVGANAGFYTLVAKAVNPSMEVHAFEPSKDWHERFNRNCSVNGYSIHSHNIALSNIDGETKIKSVWRERNNSFQAKTMDSFIKENGIERMDLLKIDVDHYIVETIEGFQETFPKLLPNMMLEIHEDEYAVRIEEILQTKKHGYLYFNIDDNNFSFRQVDNLDKRSDDMNFFICHESVAKEINLIS